MPLLVSIELVLMDCGKPSLVPLSSSSSLESSTTCSKLVPVFFGVWYLEVLLDLEGTGVLYLIAVQVSHFVQPHRSTHTRSCISPPAYSVVGTLCLLVYRYVIGARVIEMALYSEAMLEELLVPGVVAVRTRAVVRLFAF